MKALDQLNASFLGLPGPGAQPDALDQARWAALGRVVEWVRKHSPFYRELLSGLEPGLDCGPDDLARLPFTTPAELIQRPMDMLCLSQSQVERVITVHTSGSSGPAKRVFFSKAELQDTADFFRAGLHDVLGPDCPVMAILPHDTPDGAGHLLGQALEAAGRPCRLAWPVEDIDELARQLREQKPGCLVGLPVHLLGLAEALGPGVAQAVLFCSEYVPAALRRRVERALSAPSFIHYGSTESGLGGAVECAPGRGCHPRADIIWEVVEPGGDAPMPDGQVGELVITTLRRRAMPLIRYRTGDLACLSHKPCPCGTSGPRITWLGGRLAGPRLAGPRLAAGLVLRQADLDEALFAIPGLMDFRAGLRRNGSDELYIEYLSNGPEPDLGQRIGRALEALPSLALALERGQATLAPPRKVTALAASHTIKRVITDLPEQGGF